MTHDPEAAERLARDQADAYFKDMHDDVVHEWAQEAADLFRDLAALIRAQADEIDALRGALLDAASHLVAAISLLERGGKAAKKAASSDKMFDQMLNDYRASADRARAALAPAPDGSLYGDYEPITVKNRTEPDAGEREAMVAVIRKAFKGHGWLPADLPGDTADALLAEGWTRKLEEQK